MKYKREHNISKPLIKVQGVWPAIRKKPEMFYAAMREASDLVAFNPLIDYLGNDSHLDIVYEEIFSCPQIYQRVFISSTGEAMMCNSDEYGEEIIGNALEESVYDIWHGEKLNRIRALHSKENGFKEVPICQKCFYPRKTEISERVEVDGRTILIENYINRKQQIGV
jgi:radical SAM protein with 4Fe4S-binding SPASM domain